MLWKTPSIGRSRSRSEQKRTRKRKKKAARKLQAQNKEMTQPNRNLVPGFLIRAQTCFTKRRVKRRVKKCVGKALTW